MTSSAIPNESLIQMLLREANDGKYGNIALILGVIVVPVIAAWISKWLTGRKIAKLYEARLRDKDQEIERLAAHNKRLENQLLKNKRP